MKKLRFVTAASLFDGHDVSINIMRRLLQSKGVEVIHLGHNRSAGDVVNACLQEDAHAIALSSYQGGHNEYFTYVRELLNQAGANKVKIFGGGGGVITQIVIDVKDPLPPERIVELDLQVVDSSSAISYTNSNQKIFLGDSLISSVPTSSNGVLSNFSISPSASTIPGLVFDSNTGQVSGTPSQINSGVEFIISADWTFEVNGESHTVKSTTGYFIQVNVAAPHFSIPILSVEYDVGEEIMFYTPSNGGQVSSWTITGELPDGLEFDTQKGTITGKAKESSSSTYLIKAYNDDGSAEYSLELIIVGDSNDSFGSMVSDVGWSGFFAFALFFILGVASADFIKSRFQDNDEIHEEKKSHDLDKIHSENQEEISNSDSDDVTDDSEE